MDDGYETVRRAAGEGRRTVTPGARSEGEGRPGSPFPASELFGAPVPERRWCIEPLIPDRNVTLFTGDGGVGKSLLALQMAVAAATGMPWLGMSVAADSAFYLSAEDDREELHRRLAAISIAEDVPISDMEKLQLWSIAGESALLSDLGKNSYTLRPTPLFERLLAWLLERRPKLVVLDTLADLFGGNENERSHARQFIAMLRKLAIEAECSVLLLAHPSLNGRANNSGHSGSTAWQGSVRSHLYLQRSMESGEEADPDLRTLTLKKANYAGAGTEINVRWKDGVFLLEGPMSPLDRQAASAKAKRVFLKLLRQFEDQHRHVGASPSRIYAPSVFSDHPDREGVSKNGFRLAMEGLLASGEIELREDTSAPKSRRKTVLSEVRK